MAFFTYLNLPYTIYNSDVSDDFLHTLIDFLKKRIAANDYENLEIEIKYIKDNVTNFESDTLFMGIINDLESLKTKQASPTTTSVNPVLQKYSDSNYRVLDINQNTDLYTGNGGNCYGFTMAMADKEISPRHLPEQRFAFNKRVHRYQLHQIDREKDQKKIKRTRLTMRIYCPDANKQAQKIIQLGKKYPEKDLMLMTYGVNSGHASYLKIADKTIHYMDPNYGGYRFDNENDFINFYVATHKAVHQPHSFTLVEMKYDPHVQEEKSFLGKWRSFLTGSKYLDSGKIVERTNNLLIYGGLGLIMGVAVGLGLASMLAPPFAAVVVSIAAITGAFFGVRLVDQAYKRGFRGVLSVPYFFLHDLFHTRKNEPPQELDNEQRPLLEESSTCKTFRGLAHNPNSKQNKPKGQTISMCQSETIPKTPLEHSSENQDEERYEASSGLGKSS